MTFSRTPKQFTKSLSSWLPSTYRLSSSEKGTNQWRIGAFSETQSKDQYKPESPKLDATDLTASVSGGEI